jgi:hypothetical protein
MGEKSIYSVVGCFEFLACDDLDIFILARRNLKITLINPVLILGNGDIVPLNENE